MAYATYGDYMKQYPSSTDSQGLIEYLLEQATDAIDMAFRLRGRTLPSETEDELLQRQCARVCCQLVNRQIGAASMDFADATQVSMTAGVYSQSYTLAGNGTNMKLNSADLLALGLVACMGFATAGGADV